jgi:hypothetical protein
VSPLRPLLALPSVGAISRKAFRDFRLLWESVLDKAL